MLGVHAFCATFALEFTLKVYPKLAPDINSWLSLFFSVLMFRTLCDHIVYALYEVDVLHIGLNELSAGLDTVFGMPLPDPFEQPCHITFLKGELRLLALEFTLGVCLLACLPGAVSKDCLVHRH